MAEPITIYGGQSPEEIAFKLLYAISWGENIDLEDWGKADRKWILDTYAQCLETVKNPAARIAQSASEVKERPPA